MAKKSFEDELLEVRQNPTLKRVVKFLKKRKIKVKHQVTHSRGTVFYGLVKDPDIKGGRRPIAIVVPHETPEDS